MAKSTKVYFITKSQEGKSDRGRFINIYPEQLRKGKCGHEGGLFGDLSGNKAIGRGQPVS